MRKPSGVAAVIASLVALTAGALATSAVGGQTAAPPLKLVLTSDVPTSLPYPEWPHARVVLTITQPRRRADGYFVSLVRVRRLELPEHRGHFFRADFGPYFKYLCEDEECIGDVRWIYSSKKLEAMRRFGVRIEAFVARPTGRIHSVAGGRIEGRDIRRPAPPTSPSMGFAASLDSTQVVPALASVPSARGRLTGALENGRGCVWGCIARYRIGYAGLTGPPTDIVIRFGRAGENGHVWNRLCSTDCPAARTGSLRGRFGIPGYRTDFPRDIYVEISTRRHPQGEARGQIELR